jgi:hypothetical protein
LDSVFGDAGLLGLFVSGKVPAALHFCVLLNLFVIKPGDVKLDVIISM